MKYFILSGGFEEITIQEMKSSKILKDLHLKNLLVIPFATGNRIAWKFMQIGLKTVFKSKVEVLYPEDSHEKLLEKIHNSDGYFFLGGAQIKILTWLKKLEIKEELQNHFESGKVKMVYGGSAGEMVLGYKTIIGFKDVKRVVEGLNFVKNTILESHYSTRNRKTRFLPVLREYKDAIGIAIDERTIGILDENLKVHEIYGDGKIFIYKNLKESVYDKNNIK